LGCRAGHGEEASDDIRDVFVETQRRFGCLFAEPVHDLFAGAASQGRTAQHIHQPFESGARLGFFKRT